MTDVTGTYTAGYELCGLIFLLGAVASFLCIAPRLAGRPVMAEPQPSTS